MSFFSDNFINDLIVIMVIILTGIILYYKWSFRYWKNLGLEYLEPSIPFGNTTKLFTLRANFGEQFAEFYHQLKNKGLKHGGVYMFARPYYIPTDPSIIKQIMLKDFGNFVDRGLYINEEVDPLSGHLFSLEGDKWRNLRAKLTCTFTSGKMKMMFETMANCAGQLEDLLKELTDEPIEIKEILSRFTIDVISSCAFGLESNSLKNLNTKFSYYGKRMFENTTWENIRFLIQFSFPRKFLELMKFKFTKPDVEEFMMNLVRKTVDYREKNDIFRKDFLHLLLQLKNRGKLVDDGAIFENNNKNKDTTLTFNELAAQVFVFFAAGYETSSTTMTFTLYELSLQENLQHKLRKEINDTLKKYDNKITYEALMEMHYMDKCINETLRKYPPLPFLNRQCTTAYDIPNTNIHLDKGTMVVIPILGLQNDPEYYPNPSKYDPERFSDENKSTLHPFTWMPFGEGPRNCIGLRFGLLQTKIGLTTLLRNYHITLNNKTERPLKMDPKNFMMTSLKGIWLNISKVH